MNPNAFVQDYNPESDSDEESKEYDDLDMIFQSMEMSELTPLFKKHKIDMATLLTMDEQDLINCGVELVGDRKRIINFIGQAHCEKWQASSIDQMTKESLHSTPGIYTSVNDMNKHIALIGAAIRYLEIQVEKKPEILEYGKDYVGVAKIKQELEDMLATFATTHKKVQALLKIIQKHNKNPCLQPANHIDRTQTRGALVMGNRWYVVSKLLSLARGFVDSLSDLTSWSIKA